MTHVLPHASKREAIDYIFRNITKQCGCGKKTTWSCKKGSGLSHTHGISEMGWEKGKSVGYVVTNSQELLVPYGVAIKTATPHCPLPRKINGQWQTLELEARMSYIANDENWYTAVHPLG